MLVRGDEVRRDANVGCTKNVVVGFGAQDDTNDDVLPLTE